MLSRLAALLRPRPQVRRFARGDWHFAVAEADRLGGKDPKSRYMAWCKRFNPTTASMPLWEPGEVWFEYGRTEDEAVEKLWREVTALPLPRR